jgi:hypothetical protein
MKSCIEKLALNIMSEAAAVSEIRKCHPLFKHLSLQGSRMLFRHGKLFFFKPLQVLFKEHAKQNILAVPLYGRVILRGSNDVPAFVDSSKSLGEETFFMEGYVGRYLLI